MRLVGTKNEYRAAEAAYRVTFAMENAVFVLESFAYTEVEEQEAASGADASNPTAAVNYQDLRCRYFDLDKRGNTHSFETEGAYVFHPRLKVTNELRYVRTDSSGSWETDFEELKIKKKFPDGYHAIWHQSKISPGSGVAQGSRRFLEGYGQRVGTDRAVGRFSNYARQHGPGSSRAALCEIQRSGYESNLFSTDCHSVALEQFLGQIRRQNTR